MRIALDATYSVDPHASGIAIYSRELMAGLAEKFPREQFLHCYRPKQWTRAPRAADTTVRRRLLLPAIPTFRADVFHALNQRVDSRPTRAVVSTFHDLFVMTGQYSSAEFRKRFTAQARRAAANSDRIIAVSQFTADLVADLLQFDRSRIRVVYHGVNPPDHSFEASRENTVLFVGALQIRKNVSRLVEAFERIPSDWRLVLAGSTHGYGADQIIERIARSPARERITMPGYLPRSELDRLYATASIFAFPSLDEGFGIPVLDAMAHGVPVVTSSRSSSTSMPSAMAEIAGDAAVFVNPENTDEIAAALARLMKDPDLRETLSRRGRERARLYTWDRAVSETYQVYRDANPKRYF
ncbi:MAG: glycosyltransferase family 4 protein [Acidobacteriaceae bacterium]|nr:glycosyltransferase family 4 protein [Acidobacteriaceae bacterium]